MVSTDVGGIHVVGTGGYIVKEVPDESPNAPTAPDYNASVLFSASVSAATRDQINAKLSATRREISNNPHDINQWIALGGLYELASDYSNAEKIWLYVSLKWPSEPTAFGNLGDLYMNYLKNYPKAEANYLADIHLRPIDLNAYHALFSLYTTKYKQGTAAAENILKQGISANPKAVDLQVLLARYYNTKGLSAEAQATYQAAITNAKSQGNADLAAQIQAEADGN